MTLTSKRNLKNLFKKHDKRPSKGLGQNFLIDKKIVKKIISAASLDQNDTVLEIGPGPGALTAELCKKAKKVIAVEKDRKMAEILQDKLKEFKNIKIIGQDILKISFENLLKTRYKIVANLPFYLTAPVIRRFLESNCQPKEMVLVVQKEVGQRICAKPPKMSLLAVSVQFYAKAEIISYISKRSFWPQPKVNSAIVKITPFKNGWRKSLSKLFFLVVKAGFSHPRKQILNNLCQGLSLNEAERLVLNLPKVVKLSKEEISAWLLKNNLQSERRAETLNIEDWFNLTKSFKKNI